jgi:hypothetical protein
VESRRGRRPQGAETAGIAVWMSTKLRTLVAVGIMATATLVALAAPDESAKPISTGSPAPAVEGGRANARATRDTASLPVQASAQLVTPGPTTSLPPFSLPVLTPAPTSIAIPTASAKPTELRTPTPVPRKTGVYGNPWGYDFSPGRLIYSPPLLSAHISTASLVSGRTRTHMRFSAVT